MCRGSKGDTGAAAEQQNILLQQQFDQSQAQSRAQFDAQMGMEMERLGQVNSAMQGVNSAFENRGNVYGGLENATYNMNKNQLQDNREDSGRTLKFALARNGLSGGSVDVDKNSELLDRYNSGLIQARSHASNVAGDARGRDEQLRSSLMGMAGSGAMSGGQAYQMASSGLQNQASAPSFLPGMGNIFAGLSDAIGQASMMQGMRGYPGQEDDFNSTFSTSPGTNYGGQVT